MNTYCIYFHINPTTNTIFYVGQGKSKYRATIKRGRSRWWKNYVNAHGFKAEIKHTGLSKLEANIIECFYIKQIGRKDLGCGPLINLTDGGDGTENVKMSEETKMRMSISKMGHKHSEETIKKIAEASSKYRHTDATKEKLRKIHMGLRASIETRRKMSIARKGKPNSIKTKQLKSIALKGRIPHPSTLINASLVNSKPVIAIKDCAIIEFRNSSEAAQELSISRSSMRNYIEKNKVHNGYNLFYL